MEADILISSLRETDAYIEAIYLNGGCWQFHKFLKVLFHDAEPYKVSIDRAGHYDHIISKIGDEYYDITGNVNPSDYCDCIAVNENDLTTLESWSFSRNNLLFRNCPYCEEEILMDTKGNIAAWG